MILHYGDLADSSNLIKIISDVQPTEIYNLAAQSHVKVSFDMPGKHDYHENQRVYCRSGWFGNFTIVGCN